MAYDKNTDYMALMNAAKAKGDMAAYIDAENKREEKLAAMNAAGTNTQGYTSTRTTTPKTNTPTVSTTPTNFAGSTKSATKVSPAAQQIINQMNANSLKWYTDPASRNQLTAANQTLAQQLSALKETDENGAVVTYAANHNSASGEWTVTPNYAQATPMNNAGVKPTQPQLAGLELGDKYGITYDQPTIQKLLDDATKAQFALRNQQQVQSENKFYNTMLDTQGTALDSLRKSQASAVATGASRGMAAANELSAILNLQQASTDESTLLAQNRDNLNIEEAAGYKQNASDSLNTSNTLKQAIANLAATKYGYDTQGYAANLSYLAALADVAAQKYSSDSTLAGVKYNADANVAAAGKTYGTSGNTYTGGNGGVGAGADTSSNPELALKIAGAGADGYTLEGTDIKVVDNKDGTFTVKAPGYNDVTDASLDDITRIQNNKDIKAIDDNYAVATVNKTTDPANNKHMSEREVLNYYNRYGKAPTGWKVTGDVATYIGAQLDTSQNVSTTGKDGQKVAVGYNGKIATWTYNAKTGMWSGDNGAAMSAASFKLYINQQNNDYVKALN